MKTSPRVRPVPPTGLDQLDDSAYDAVLASLGFEERSRAIPQALAAVRNRAVVRFLDRQGQSYEANERFFASTGWDVPALGDEQLSVEWIGSWLSGVLEDPDVERIAIDVSSMSRPRIATVIETVIETGSRRNVEVDLLYTPSAYQSLSPDTDPPVLSVQPVTGYFAGWWSNLDEPLHAIIAVGYELERASSAIDQLEPESAEVFLPIGTDSRYLADVKRANDALFRTQSINDIAEYAVGDPFRCFRTLEARVHRLAQDHRVAIVALGPKIFAACSLLVGALHPDAVQVIRVSAEEREQARDQVSDGRVYGLRLIVGSPRELSDTRWEMAVNAPDSAPAIEKTGNDVEYRGRQTASSL